MGVSLKQIDFLKEESCDSENDDEEDSPDIFVFLGLVKNLKKKVFIRLYSSWDPTFLDEQSGCSCLGAGGSIKFSSVDISKPVDQYIYRK
jgi:hypothetical protein